MKTLAMAIPTLTLAASVMVSPAQVAEVRGQVVDSLRQQVYAGARVTFGDLAVISDAGGFYRLAEVPAGAYLVRIQPWGETRTVIGRVLVGGTQKLSIVHLDLSKIDPPDDDADY